MPLFTQATQSAFPGAIPSADFLRKVRATLDPLGFTPGRALPIISVCRDELTAQLVAEIHDIWGPAFTVAGLGGLPAMGRTGWAAAFAHVPLGDEATDGRGRVLIFGFPHIGIEDDGSIGVTVRVGQTEPTATCGALVATLERVRAGDVPSIVDVDDYEATKLATRLVDPADPPAHLVELTKSALDAIEEDLWRAVDESVIWRDHDVSVWCGVQIHAHRSDWVWPRDAWTMGADGDRRRLDP